MAEIDGNVDKVTVQKVNLKMLGRTSPRLRSGDVFAMFPPDGRYLFGRVVRSGGTLGEAPMPGANLVYVYSARSDDPSPKLGELRRDTLLIPPIYTNRLGWVHGYFKNVGHAPPTDADLLEHHCFLRWNGDYLDEQGRVVTERREPCGDWELASYRAIDDLISDALQLPRAPAD